MTEQRHKGCDGSRHRYPRSEVLLESLRSYARLSVIRRAFLLIELDDTTIDAGVRQRVRRLAMQLFGERLMMLRWRRLLSQAEWRVLLPRVVLPGDNEHLVWFLQSEDHVFVDAGEAVLRAGLSQMCSDRAAMKSLYTSHWPDALLLAHKFQWPQRRGDYIRARLTLTDSVQIVNARYLRWLLLQLDWRGANFTRTDDLVRMSAIYGEHRSMKGALLHHTSQEYG